jgi:excisionase family DNA binding protein
MNAPADKLLLSLDEVKDLTGVGRTNLYREIREKRLRARKQGAKTVVTKADLITWINQLPDYRSNDPAGSNHL